MTSHEKCTLLTCEEKPEPVRLIKKEVFSDGHRAIKVDLCPEMDDVKYEGFGGLLTTDDPWINDILNWSDGY